jgi:hypothetical protein
VKLAEELIRFGEQLTAENTAASDLWSWLPSHKVAVKHHGDYAHEHTPSNKDVMHEAALYIAQLLDGSQRDYTEEEKEWFTRCPCGEDHLP